MIDHFILTVTDLRRFGVFYRAVLDPLGFAVIYEDDDVIGFGTSTWGFGLIQGPKPPPMHIAFTAPSHQAVDAFHAAGLAQDVQSNGAPGLRPEYGATYYAGFLIDPDGHNIEAVCR